ncbi:ras gtpase-activating protein [Anaeramoeba flamelloides]|uniref:Ras gtpase-activating protein n=1 Tax=Anaeramoeba flamelloides TaxID=1746091 RepID=A0AAV7ZW97_9EUKA|nr:ras gtpase-activating protein [Anaeramoeba flamelloides]
MSEESNLELLLDLIKKHPQTEHFLKSLQKEKEKLVGEEILTIFINFQLEKLETGKKITNFDNDFKDCSVLAYFLHSLTNNSEFLNVFEKQSLIERSKLFIKVLEDFQFSFPLCSVKDITEGNSTKILELISNICLDYFSELESKTKMEENVQQIEKQIQAEEKELSDLKKECSLLSETFQKEEDLAKYLKTGDIFDFTNQTESLIKISSQLKSSLLGTLKVISQNFVSEDENIKLYFQKILKASNKQVKEVIIWETKLILLNSLVQLIKSHQQENFTEKLHLLIKIEINNIKNMNVVELEKSFKKILNLLKEHKIWTRHINPVYKSITSLFDQFIFFSQFRYELAKSLSTIIINEKLYSNTKMQLPEKSEIIDTIFGSLEQIIPGIVSDKYLNQALTNFLNELELGKTIDLEKMIKDCRQQAIGITLDLLVKKYCAPNTYQRIVDYFENEKLVKKDLPIYKKCHEILKEYINEDTNKYLCKLFDSTIIRDSAKTLSFVLFNFFDTFGLSLPLIYVSIRYEILTFNGDVTNLFKTNSMSSLFSVNYCLLYGDNYLKKTLAPILNQLVQSNPNFTIPSGATVDDPLAIEAIENVQRYFIQFITVIFAPNRKFPIELKILSAFYKTELPKKLQKYLPQTLAPLILHRFISPAIASPENFDLVSTKVPNSIRRGLINISQVVQKLANNTTFNEYKVHMSKLNSDIKHYFNDRDQFCDRIVKVRLTNLKRLYKPYSETNEVNFGEPIKAINVRKLINRINWNDKFNIKNFSLTLLVGLQKIGEFNIKSSQIDNQYDSDDDIDEEDDVNDDEDDLSNFFGKFGCRYTESINNQILDFKKSLIHLNCVVKPLQFLNDEEKIKKKKIKINESSRK